MLELTTAACAPVVITDLTAPRAEHRIVEPPPAQPTQLESQRQRRDSIRRRLDELAVPPARPARGDLAATRRLAKASQLAARSALMSYRDALYRAAQAHDRAASAHQRAARTTGNATHDQMTAFHRAAAAEDRRRAEQIRV